MKKIILTAIVLLSAVIIHAQTDTTLQQYTGKYKFPEGSPVTEINVTLESGVLMANSSQGNTELKRTEGDVFSIVAYGGTATFKRTEGKVSGVLIQVQDITMEGTKSEGPFPQIPLHLPAVYKYDMRWVTVMPLR